MANEGDMAICGLVHCPHGLQGFLSHLSGYVGGHQHGAEFARSKKALRTQISFERPSMYPATKPVAAP
jgi:hypothetical protein